MRRANFTRRALVGLSHFFEGRSHLGSQRRESAEKEFERALDYDPPSPRLGMMMAQQWTKLGYPRFAGELLGKLELVFADDPSYWHAVAVAAHDRRDAATLATAAERAHRLAPDNPMYASNHAAVLLILRERPVEAIQLTLQLFHAYPRSAVTRINRGMALLLSLRTEETAALLQGIDPASLSAEESTAYYLAMYEVYLNRRDHDRAQNALKQIDRRHLFPSQLDWLDVSTGTLMAIAPR